MLQTDSRLHVFDSDAISSVATRLRDPIGCPVGGSAILHYLSFLSSVVLFFSFLLFVFRE